MPVVCDFDLFSCVLRNCQELAETDSVIHKLANGGTTEYYQWYNDEGLLTTDQHPDPDALHDSDEQSHYQRSAFSAHLYLRGEKIPVIEVLADLVRLASHIRGGMSRKIESLQTATTLSVRRRSLMR